MRLFYLIVMLSILAVGCRTTEENSEPTPTMIVSPTAVPTEITLPRSVIGDIQTRSSDGMVMVYVPAGEFVMGSNEEDVDFAPQQCKAYGTNCQRRYFSVEMPMHSVVLDSSWIDRTEVTYGQYQQCLSTGTCDALGCQEELSTAREPCNARNYQKKLDWSIHFSYLGLATEIIHTTVIGFRRKKRF